MATSAAGTALVGRVAQVAEQVLAPAAGQTERCRVRRATLDALAPTGLYGMAVDPDVDMAAVREVTETLAAADASTWFVTAQHHLVARTVIRAGTGIAQRLGPDLRAGRLIGGQGISQLRRPGPATLRASRVLGGWRFDGTIPWYTGWGLNDIALLAGRTGGDRDPTGGDPDGTGGAPDQAVFAVVPAVTGQLHASAPLDLLAMSATATVSLRVEGLRVGDEDVVRVLPLDRWAAADARRTPNANPAVFGVARAALADLAEVADRQPALGEAVTRFRARLERVRAEAYRLLDEVPDEEALDLRLGLRVAAIRVALDVTAAAVAAHAGAAMASGHPAQRRAREALFLAVQAQTAEVRAATVSSLAG